ncbi:hypothetical protein BD410DRAFT_546775 [Rickenella mellea]|uniref:Secreted protein n=1 Tax=Rickenella mellea TaxID=50990 RepID=A0A4Y7PQ29_9AGAM|nr:hypothetical protein BD410DRAFT_546775 [Rickenella mellea]
MRLCLAVQLVLTQECVCFSFSRPPLFLNLVNNLMVILELLSEAVQSPVSGLAFLLTTVACLNSNWNGGPCMLRLLMQPTTPKPTVVWEHDR